jgi:hypothetical protein
LAMVQTNPQIDHRTGEGNTSESTSRAKAIFLIWNVVESTPQRSQALES